MNNEGILLIDKPAGRTSFSLIKTLRKRLNIQKIGHAGTLDPLACGVMVILLGRAYTRLSDQFLKQDKEYKAQIHLGVSTETFDTEGSVTAYSEKVPSEEEILAAVTKFQGSVMQVPPMYSAKKVNGQALYKLARQGKIVPRDPVEVHLKIEILAYHYPHLELKIACSKGTYIRSLANDLGAVLGCGGHLSYLQRTRSGQFSIDDCLEPSVLEDKDFDFQPCIKKIANPFICTTTA